AAPVATPPAPPALVDAGASGSRTARAVPGYPATTEPATIACTLRGAWNPEQPRSLQLRPGGKVFGKLATVKHAELALTGDSRVSFVELTGAEQRFWGYVSNADLHIHAARPIVIAGFAIPGGTAVMHPRSATASVVSIDLQLPAGVRAITPVRQDVACTDLTLDEPQLDARAAIAEPTLEQAMLRGKQSIPLSLTPTGKPVARLTYKDETPLVDIVERRGAMARIVVLVHSLNPLDNVTLVGWVPAAAVGPHDSGFGGSWGTGGQPATRKRRKDPTAPRVTCTHEVPLVADVAGDRALVGAILPKVVIEVGARRGELVEVRTMTYELELADHAVLLTRPAELADCTTAP
ncbi:MAG: hypothetical protein M3619_23330, partial [Myxococcota bacterium]|nr:hypothetical protein [Myxococcota bacterium]